MTTAIEFDLYYTSVHATCRGATRDRRLMEHLLSARLAPGGVVRMVDVSVLPPGERHAVLERLRALLGDGTLPTLPLLLVSIGDRAVAFSLTELQRLCDDELTIKAAVLGPQEL